MASIVQDFTVISPHEYEARVFNSKKIHILITFDDGYDSWVTICAPVLKKYGIQALFFVNSGLLALYGTDTEQSAFVRENLMLSPKRTLSFDGMRFLMREGHTIGGHTENHKRLREVTHAVLVKEVQNDKKKIEHELGASISHFAYPFGARRDYSPETEQFVRSSGYSYVYIAEPGFVSNTDSHIPRTLIEKHQSYSELRLWMYGAYDLFTELKRSLRSIYR
jgi:peptidoglycan/xylan/chitin deacetylase (PgdA/CDA1 family)